MFIKYIVFPSLIFGGVLLSINLLYDRAQDARDRRERIAKFSYATGCIEATINRCSFYYAQHNNDELHSECLDEGQESCESKADTFTGWIYRENSF